MANVNYTNEYRNPAFPSEVMERGSFIDVDDSIGSIINQINTYRSQGKYDMAESLIRQNADVIAKASFDSFQINALIEEIRNTQIYALQANQEIATSSEEPFALVGSVWIEVQDDV